MAWAWSIYLSRIIDPIVRNEVQIIYFARDIRYP